MAWSKLREQELQEPEKVAGWLVGIGRNLARKTTREVMILYYREEQSTPRVSELLGISVSAAEQRLSRGRKMLRAKVEHALGEELLRTRPTAAFTDRVAAALPLGFLAPAASPASSSPFTKRSSEMSTRKTRARSVIHGRREGAASLS